MTLVFQKLFYSDLFKKWHVSVSEVVTLYHSLTSLTNLTNPTYRAASIQNVAFNNLSSTVMCVVQTVDIIDRSAFQYKNH
jgi:hypothetical protein